MFMQLCKKVTLYGFGKTLGYDAMATHRPKVPYHYFVGHEARTEGVPGEG